MSRFNTISVNPRTTVNYGGAPAYLCLNPEQQLYAMSACNLVSDTYYKSADESIDDLLKLVSQCDSTYVAALAVFLRKELYLRSVPLVLLAGLALQGRLDPWMVSNTISRADEITELLSLWQEINITNSLRPWPHALKNGLALAFSKFDSFDFRKYNRQGKGSVSFKDAIKLVRPRPKNAEQGETFTRLLNDKLDPIVTWETEITKAGSSDSAKKATWESLIRDKKLPYMAALRNVKNILKAQVDDDVIELLLDQLRNPQQILNSKLFPFRWFSAYNRLSADTDINVRMNLPRFQRAFEEAISISIANIPGIDQILTQSVLIACDVSGSMQKPLSSNSSVQLFDVGLLLGNLLSKKCNKVITGVFGDEWAPCNFGPSLLSYPRLPFVGFSTNGSEIIRWLNKLKLPIDNIMLFSDQQIYNDMLDPNNPRSARLKSAFEQEWNFYKKTSPNTKIYLFNLASYGNFPLDLVGQDVYMISGWSPSIFRILGDLNSWNACKNHIMTYLFG